MMQVVILAGGLGTRLSGEFRKTPKSLVPVSGKPFLAHQLNLLIKRGITKVLLLVGYHADLIYSFVAEQNFKRLEVSFSQEPDDRLLGTGGALKWAEPHLEDDFFLLYGDSYLPIDYSKVEDFYWRQNRSPLMTVYANRDSYDISNVEVKENRVVYYSKGEKGKWEYIDYGLMVFNKNCLSGFVRGYKFDLSDIIQGLVEQKRLLACKVFQRFWEVGSLQGIKELEVYLSETK